MSDRGRVWCYCVTHDVRFLTRSPASLEHMSGNVPRDEKLPCLVVPG